MARFIGYSGWEDSDDSFAYFRTRLSFFPHAEQPKPTQRHSRYEELYKEKLKLTKKQPSETYEFPDIYVQPMQFLTVKTIDLKSTVRSKQHWSQQTKHYFKLPATKQTKPKETFKPAIKEPADKQGKAEKAKARLSFQYN